VYQRRLARRAKSLAVTMTTRGSPTAPLTQLTEVKKMFNKWNEFDFLPGR
jgi:hypothetical protein